MALLDALEAGEWLQDDMLPSEFELADRFGVSQGTVRKALDDLVIEQVLSRRQGKGTFVARYPDEWQRVAVALQLRRGASIVQVRRLLRIRDQAVALEDVVLSLELFEGLDARKIKQCGGALYELYHRVFGVRVVTTRERSRAVLADRDDARLLDVEHAAPLLEVVRVAYASADKPVEWRKVICRNDVYSYTNRL